jgi:hypothetical protein
MLWSQYKLATIRSTEFLRKEITGIPNIANRNSNFLTLQTSEFQKKNPTRIFEIEKGIGILLTMGVPEIGTKNWNSQPRQYGASSCPMPVSSGFWSSPGHVALGNALCIATADWHGHQKGQRRRNMLMPSSILLSTINVA